MERKYKFVEKSRNQKIGIMATTYSSRDFCPDTCQLKESLCYAKKSFVGMVWSKVTKGTDPSLLTYSEMISKIRALKAGSYLRMNTAGDLETNKNGTINRNKLRQLISATRHLVVFHYTHHKDPETVRWANEQGYNLISSVDSVEELQHYHGCPTSLVLDKELHPLKHEVRSDWKNRISKTVREVRQLLKSKGRQLVLCPAQYPETSQTCKSCKICSRLRSDQTIGFISH